MAAYYNEFKPEAAHMLRELIKDGLIAAGDVDERSITEVTADDIRGYTQAHFFAGIGGWSVALRLAGWPDDRPVWTGSCPCQPFSTAGKQKGKADERHLWPVWARLIRECRPPVIYGEQVASAITHGWWDDVADDLEGEGYAVGAAVLPACSVGKPHKRDRLWFVADSELRRCERQQVEQCSGLFGAVDAERKTQQPVGAHGSVNAPSCAMGNTKHDGRDGRQVAGGNGAPVQHDAQGAHLASQLTGASEPSDVANTNFSFGERTRFTSGIYSQQPNYNGNLSWLACPDGKQRPVEPSICLLAHGVQHRAPILHAFGNAIVPSLAAAFIQATFRGNQ